MNEMMGFGGLGIGGSSSSSSNLSALAPPFTVDRSNSKPNSSSVMHFTEPPYPVPFYSSYQHWPYSHSSASRPDIYSNLGSEVDSIRTTCMTTANDYRYLGSQSVHPTSAHIPPMKPNVTAATDTFTFLQFSGDIPSKHVEPTPYHPQGVSTRVDDHITLEALNEPYDILSTSCVRPLGASSQVDYTQSLSGLEYTPQWGSFWNGLSDEDHGQRVELGGNFCSEEMNVAGSYVYKNPMNQGASTTESLSKCQEAVISNQVVPPSIGKLNDEFSPLQDTRFVGGGSSRTFISGIKSSLPESSVQAPSVETVPNLWNYEKPHSASYDKFFQPLDSCMNEHIALKNLSSSLAFRSTSLGTTSTMQNEVYSEDKNTISSVAAIDSKDYVHDPFNRKDVHLSDKAVPADASDDASKAGTEYLPDNFKLALDSVKGFTSVNDFTESLDHYNPAVDSPCWKGAPAFRFCPSDVLEAATPQHSSKKFGANVGSNLQQTQTSPSSNDDTTKVSYQSICGNTAYQGNGYVELGSLLLSERVSNANFPAREHSSTDAVKAGVNCAKPSSSSNRSSFSNVIDRPRSGYDLPNESRIDCETQFSQTKQSGLDQGESISERVFKICASVADTGLNVKGATEDGCSAFHLKENTACSPCFAEDGNKLAKLRTFDSTPKANVQMLVNTIQNLSEILLSHCSNSACAVSEQDHEALKHAINNLETCVSKKTACAVLTKETVFPCGNSDERKEFPNQYKDLTAGGAVGTRTSSHVLSDHHSANVGSRKCHASDKDIKKFPALVPPKNDTNSLKDVKMVQALKEVLKENFDDEEEMPSETLLYKNLWLEAEAALCSISYKARFDRLKLEMDKCKSHKAKDVIELTESVDKLQSLKVSSDPNMPHPAVPEAKDSPTSDNSVRNSPKSTTTKIVDGVDASVLARFHILKCRGENSNSVNPEEQQLPEVGETGFMSNMGPQSQYSSGTSKLDRFSSSTWDSEHEITKDASVLARFHILKCRGENSNSVNPEEQHVPEVGETGFLSNMGPQSHYNNGTSKVDIFSPSTWDSEHEITNDPSILARFSILKCRGENSTSINPEEQHVPEVGETGFMSNVGSQSQYSSRKSEVDKFSSAIGESEHGITKDFGICGIDDQVNSCGANRSGWYDVSDWEHVLKDEYAGQRC